ncbi:hypothetical protein [Pseudomonas prosekii]|uniref:hypothetical protein n=1 Tax=Pseudomonas prosekii TaxID=1148509 RepID=UPI003F74C8A5
MHPTTPDGRYFVVKGQLWRCSNPSLSEAERQGCVDELMAARREVKAAKASGDPAQMKAARAHVQAAKVALGERGPVWWADGAPDFNRRKVRNTPYADWFEAVSADVSSNEKSPAPLKKRNPDQ